MRSEAPGLLDPAFLVRLGRLTLRARRAFRSHSVGEKRSPLPGSGLEFAGYRGYVAGDDLRHLDWALLARLERPFVRIFEQEADLTVSLLIDASRSMDFGSPSKFTAALRLAAALGYIAISSMDRVGAVFFDGDGFRVHGPARGRRALFPLFRFLESGEASGPGGLERGLRLHAAAARPGLTIVLSDFLDPRFREALLPHRFRRHSLVLVHILAPEELAPSFEGDLRLVDSESGAGVEISVGARERAAYVRRIESHREEVRRFGMRYGADIVSLSSDVPLEEAVWEHLLRTTAVTGS